MDSRDNRPESNYNSSDEKQIDAPAWGRNFLRRLRAYLSTESSLRGRQYNSPRKIVHSGVQLQVIELP